MKRMISYILRIWLISAAAMVYTMRVYALPKKSGESSSMKARASVKISDNKTEKALNAEEDKSRGILGKKDGSFPFIRTKEVETRSRRPKGDSSAGEGEANYSGERSKDFLLFLRAGTSKKVKNSDDRRSFAVGKDEKGKILRRRGPFAIIADPTYDLTFQAIFPNNEEGKRRMKSLLNSLLYPKCDLKRSNDEMVREVEFVRTSFEKVVPEGTGKKNAGGAEGQFKQFRCDIVCKCRIGTEEQNESEKIVISYIDIEMQRKKLPGCEEEFLGYAQELGKLYRSEHPVKVLVFLKYRIGSEGNGAESNSESNEIESSGESSGVEYNSEDNGENKEVEDNGETVEIAKEMVLGVVVRNMEGEIKLDEEDKVRFSVMISLPLAVDAIKGGRSIKIQADGEELGVPGKEWLKLLGVSHWATQRKRQTQEGKVIKGYYYIPTDISCEEVKGAMEFVKQGKVNDSLYQEQLDNFFNGEAVVRRIEEQGRKKMLLGLLARKFYEKKKLSKSNIAEAQRGDFSFSETAAKEAIEAVGGTNEGVAEFISALRKVGLMQ